MISPPMTGKSFASRRITSKPNCCFRSFLGQRHLHLHLISQTATRPPLHAISSTPLDPSFLVKVGRFSTTCALCLGRGLRFVPVAVLWWKRGIPSAVVDCIASTTELTEPTLIRSPLTKYVFPKSSTS